MVEKLIWKKVSYKKIWVYIHSDPESREVALAVRPVLRRTQHFIIANHHVIRVKM